MIGTTVCRAVGAAVLVIMSVVLAVPTVGVGQLEFGGTGTCKPVAERTSEVGCWIIAHRPIGQLEQAEVFWHLDVFPSRASAEAAKGPRGTVVESLGKVWLLTIEKEGWRPPKGQGIAEIGALPIVAGEEYSAQYMEAILNPGMTSAIHDRVRKVVAAWRGNLAG